MVSWGPNDQLHIHAYSSFSCLLPPHSFAIPPKNVTNCAHISQRLHKDMETGQNNSPQSQKP